MLVEKGCYKGGRSDAHLVAKFGANANTAPPPVAAAAKLPANAKLRRHHIYYYCMSITSIFVEGGRIVPAARLLLDSFSNTSEEGYGTSNRTSTIQPNPDVASITPGNNAST